MADESEIEFDYKKVNEYLKKIRKNLKDVQDTNNRLGKMFSPIVFQDVIDHFNKEKGPDGPWEKWSASYQKAINRGWARKPGKILQDTGNLRNYFQPDMFRKKSGSYEWFNQAKTKGGFSYAAAHDQGGQYLPQRQFMWLSKEATEKILEITLRYVSGE